MFLNMQGLGMWERWPSESHVMSPPARSTCASVVCCYQLMLTKTGNSVWAEFAWALCKLSALIVVLWTRLNIWFKNSIFSGSWAHVHCTLLLISLKDTNSSYCGIWRLCEQLWHSVGYLLHFYHKWQTPVSRKRSWQKIRISLSLLLVVIFWR